MNKEKGPRRPFILYPKQNIEDVRQCVLENFGRIKYELPFLNALCIEIPQEKINRIRINRRIASMSEDIRVSKLPVSQYVYTTKRCRRPPPSPGSGGKGVTIAVIDTGVAFHYDLITPFNRILYFKDFVRGIPFPYDDDGHGTHVCGIAAGNGFSSGKHQGTAPGATLVVLKALDEEGNGNASDILAAMQWIYDYHRFYNIRVVNLSLGVADTGDPRTDPLQMGANALVCAGLCVVAAAGNSGPSTRTVTSPGVSPLVLTVGSCDSHDHIPDFSSRGPAPGGWLKPDVVAPGVDIISLSSKNSRGYVSQSGTSMSAPYVSGLAACYCAQHPRAHPLEVKHALICASRSSENLDRNAQGHGILKR